MRTLCGAKTRTGAPCQAKAVKGGKRCRIHGGASTGAPGNQNNLKHGIFGRRIREDEKEIAAAALANLANVDSEIVVVTVQLDRALAAQNLADEGDGLELDEDIKREASEYGPGDEQKRKRRDYVKHIDTLTARLESLKKTRVLLIQETGSGNDGDDMTTTDTFIAPDEPIPDKPIL